MINIDTVLEKLDEAILAKDKLKTLSLILHMKEMVRTDPVAVKAITTPSTLKHLHEMLTEHLEVPPKAMLIGQRVPHRQRRALLFVQSLENGVRRIM